MSGNVAPGFQLLSELSRLLASNLGTEAILNQIVRGATHLLNAACARLWKKDGQEVSLKASFGLEGSIYWRLNATLPLGVGLAGWIAERRSPIYSHEISEDPRVFNPQSLVAEGLVSYAGIPLIKGDRVLGVLEVFRKDRSPFSEEEVILLHAFGDAAVIAMENAKLFDELTQAKTEWEDTFNSVPDSIVIFDTESKLVRANRVFKARVGASWPELAGKKCYEIPEIRCPGPDCAHARALDKRAAISQEVENQQTGSCYAVSISPIFDSKGQIQGLLHIAQDISREKRLKEQLLQSEKMAAVGQLISGIAHELNNPLTSIIVYSELLIEKVGATGPLAQDLQTLHRQAQRATSIVRNLLNFARKHQPQRVPVSINGLIRETLDLRAYDHKVNNIQVVTELAADLPATLADPNQLKQVFLNIIINAEQAMLEAHGRGRLVIKTRLKSSWEGADQQRKLIEISISDDGPGIPKENLRKIFDPFFTTKPLGKGTGLGLSICYGIIQEHGGDIFARSSEGEGATFIIELPLITSPGRATAGCQGEGNGFELNDKAKGRRILIVDDEETIASALTDILRREGNLVDFVTNGSKALEAIKGARYDLIISDFKMPEMNGEEFYTEVQKLDPDLARRIVFISGDVILGITREFIRRTGNRMLEKPFNIQQVKQLVADFFDGEHQRA